MRPYLSEKANRKPGKRIAWPIACAIFACAAVSVIWDDVALNDWSGVAIGLVLLGLCLWPVLKEIKHLIRQRRARALAFILEQEQESVVSIERIQSAAHMQKVGEKLRDLLKAGYLQDIFVNGDQITLTAPDARAIKQGVVSIKCPDCGAPNRLIRGRVNRCAYCGCTLSGEQK